MTTNKTGTLIFENVPANTEVGIDYKSWHVGHNFKGIRNIPSGFHFVFFSSSGAPRTGFFVNTRPGDVLVRRYDRQGEDLMADELSEAELERYRTNIAEYEDGLGEYPHDVHEKWMTLTNCVSERTWKRLVPKCGSVNALTEVPLALSGKQRCDTRNVDSRLTSTLDENNCLAFTAIPSQYPVGASASDISRCNMDSSFFLQELVNTFEESGESELIGELQLAFICFILAQVYDAFEHWKALVCLFVECHATLSTRTSLFTRFVNTLRLHMKEIPEDYFVDIVAQNNILYSKFSGLFRNFSEPDGIDGELVRTVSVFRGELAAHFGWEFDELAEEEDEAPVIVEL